MQEILLEWILTITGILIVILFISYIIFIRIVGQHALRLAMEMPILIWLNIDEVEEMGYPRLSLRIILPAFHQAGLLEIRLREEMFEEYDPEEEEGSEEEEISFKKDIDYYEFRMVRRPRRRKFSLKGLFSKSFGGLEPAPA